MRTTTYTAAYKVGLRQLYYSSKRRSVKLNPQTPHLHRKLSIHSQKTSAVPATKLTFSSNDFCQLSKNIYGRFMPNSPTVGHAVLHFNGMGVTASQYTMPQAPSHIPQWAPLTEIEQISKNGVIAYQAKTQSGDTIYSNRGYQFTNENKHFFELRFFSLGLNHSAPFWYDQRLIPLTNSIIPPNIGYTRGGKEVVVDHHSVAMRYKQKRRLPSQRKVMKQPARQAYLSFKEQSNNMLTTEMQTNLEKTINAQITDPVTRKYYPEWLHATAYTLTPTWENPQQKNNLGAGPQWANTLMLLFEVMCQWYALNHPDVMVSVKPTLFMLFATDLIETILYEAQLTYQNRSLRFHHRIESLRQRYPTLIQPSDIAQMIGISQAILTDTKPAVESIVTNVDMSLTEESLAITAHNSDIEPPPENHNISHSTRNTSPGSPGIIGLFSQKSSTVQAINPNRDEPYNFLKRT